MQQRSGMPRQSTALTAAQVGGVYRTADAVLPWVVTDAAQRPIAAISEFFRDFVVYGNSAASCRSYAYDLLRWWRTRPAA